VVGARLFHTAIETHIVTHPFHARSLRALQSPKCTTALLGFDGVGVNGDAHPNAQSTPWLACLLLATPDLPLPLCDHRCCTIR